MRQVDVALPDSGVNKPYRGRIKIKQGKSVGMLPQNPELLFTRRSVREELVDASDRKSWWT